LLIAVPIAVQKKLEAWKRGEIDWTSGKSLRDGSMSYDDGISLQKLGSLRIQSLLIYLRLDNM
jgi:hypothetical protein